MIAEQEKVDYKKRIGELGQFIGNTPLLPITKVFNKPGVQLFAKLEWQQIGESVKARPAYNIIKDAVNNGLLTPGKELLDATSGNTGIAYASIGASLGIPVTLCLPENASEERKTILKAYGAKIIYTSPYEGTDGSQTYAKQLFTQEPDKYFYADQYANNSNWQAHYHTTGPEIFRQTNGQITHFVTGLGTTGTFTGTGRRLKELNPDITLISFQPDSPMHGMEGWKHLETAIVPKIYDKDLADDNLGIDTMDAYDLIKATAREEGILLSPSAAANLAGAIKVANSIENGVVVTMFPDNAAKYSEVINSIF
ncbi:pyridoxal-phosphate dependent enzyme [Flammeovirgaceae bacterium SG7u.111]|nr:pyridoxal-phosphate dependent enzyme [Flammeovirgaceae bacterium SG7u.132]WPO35757.1 pyridoxal-phosphate dependent enzyme [Flammeovirgaceae bacterium SG7u.111]